MLGDPGKPYPFHTDGTQPIQERILKTELWAKAREDLKEMWAIAKGKHTQPLGISNLMGWFSPVRREDSA